MKKLYWRPRSVSRMVLVLISVLALGGLAAVERFTSVQTQPYYSQKLQAAELAFKGMQIIQAERLKISEVIVRDLDPAGSGLIGSMMSPVTTSTAPLSAKQTTINPNFAAVLVDMLKRAGVDEGDTIAIGASGSFPALNICAYAAASVLKLQPIIISSAAASQFGANDPNLLWIDMERILSEKMPQAFPFRSVAASLGGIEDSAAGLTPEGLEMLNAAIKRNNLRLLKAQATGDSKNSIDQRMAIYTEHADSNAIAAYINLGGGTVSVGTSIGKRAFEPGLNIRKPAGAKYIDSVMTRFIDRGVPVIHLVRIERLADQYGLTLQPRSIPQPGSEGTIFARPQYDRRLVGGVLVGIIVCLFAFLRSDMGYRILRGNRKGQGEMVHEPMV